MDYSRRDRGEAVREPRPTKFGLAFLISMLCYVPPLHEAQIGCLNGRAARVVQPGGRL
jgi:hypothetical protein